MKKITLILTVAIATLFMATGCQKEYLCTDQNGNVYDCDSYGNPTGSDCGCGNGSGNNNGTGDNGSYGGYYYITTASSFESVDVDVSDDGQCDGYGTETWTVVTLFSDPIENTGPYTVVVPYLITDNQFNFQNDSYYQTSIRSLDQWYNCNWSGSFDLPYDELLSWWK